MTLRQRVLEVVADPNIAYLLMMAGLLGLYMELSNPGVILPGVAGVICLLLALLASQVLPISSTGAILVVVGFAFLLAELFVPSFGVLGFGGLLALALGSLFLYTPESELSVDRSVIALTTLAFSAAMASIVWLLLRDRRRPVRTGAEALVGARGTAVSIVHGAGKVRVHGELWNARSTAPIEKGRSVRVRLVDGLELLVEEEAGRREP
jgi:membrane-bound serine protease (ClpP class)